MKKKTPLTKTYYQVHSPQGLGTRYDTLAEAETEMDELLTYDWATKKQPVIQILVTETRVRVKKRAPKWGI